MNIKRIIILIIIILLAFVAYNYIYQDHRNIQSEKAEFVLTSEALINDFSNNPSESEQKFLNKTLIISGAITEIKDSNMVIDVSIFCQFQNSIPNSIKNGKTIKVKGRCIGFDDLLEEIKMDQCSISIE